VLTAHSIGDEIFVFGGYGKHGFDSTVQVYDPANDTWQTAAPMPNPRYIFMSQVVGGMAYVIGGQGTDFSLPLGTPGWVHVSEVDIFDPSAGWSSGAPSPEPLAGGASCSIDARIFVFGGEANNLTSIYDVDENRWTLAAPPPLARNGHSCVRAGDAFFLLGGRDVSGTALDLVEKYDPASDTWETLEPMPTARMWFGATAFGRDVYAFGGEQRVSPSVAPDWGMLNDVDVLRTGLE
jgi:serine/threonine-protein kinase PknK